jgi:hypothetical protein
MQKSLATPSERAGARNDRLMAKIVKRADTEGAVLGPGMARYRELVEAAKEPLDLLKNLTAPLLEGFDETRAVIQRNMEEKWKDDPDRVAGSVANSLRRSAGTNYQSLVSYALARYLREIGSAWYVEYPTPAELREALAIKFTAGVPIDMGLDEADAVPAVSGEDVKEEEEEEEEQAEEGFRVKPDVDILLRNAGWDEQAADGPEPVVLLSVKTSLADRAGMAARWKTYFDLATRPCPYRDKEDCVYHQLGISMDNADRYDIRHGIVTANIYKIRFHDERYRKGELASGQTRSNTYMFDLKLTTRADEEAETPADWQHFEHIAEVLAEISDRYGLPK